MQISLKEKVSAIKKWCMQAAYEFFIIGSIEINIMLGSKKTRILYDPHIQAGYIRSH